MKYDPGMDTIGVGAARARVRDLAGNEHELQELWSARPVVLAFVRHFG
jgi:hypothetical protein